ncbi:MAG: fructose-6-phosphate aldolase [Deltaproteobacteria bacterium]|nr:fructose-6-phosphate aldolase [Deltaproteobacteria bacterium]
MKIFIDTADIREIREAMELGVVDGVTTNPSLIAKTGRRFDDVVKEILSVVKGPVSLEVVATESKGMIEEGRRLAKLGPQVAVKVPMIPEGLKAVKVFSSEGIKTNVTLVFSLSQAVLAAKAGATFVSPFAGRLDDAGHDGMEVIEQICDAYRFYGFATEVIAASVRNPVHVNRAILCGCHIATVPWSVILQLAQHPLTETGLKKFLDDWKKVPA